MDLLQMLVQPVQQSIRSVISQLRNPEAAGFADLDSPEAALAFHRIIRRKPLLRALYDDFYAELLTACESRRPLIEIGSGSGFLRKRCPEALIGDILSAPGLDLQFSGLNMPFRDNSVGALVMFDVFHHVSNSARFLEEMHRCLCMGGRIAMIEPAVTAVSRIIYGRFHHEPFVPDAPDWQFPAGGPRSQANGALPWMVFVRDRALFERTFPGFSIVNIRIHTPFRYLLSGGLSYRQFLPGKSNSMIRDLEALFAPFAGILGLFMTVVLEKRPVRPQAFSQPDL